MDKKINRYPFKNSLISPFLFSRSVNLFIFESRPR